MVLHLHHLQDGILRKRNMGGPNRTEPLRVLKGLGLRGRCIRNFVRVLERFTKGSGSVKGCMKLSSELIFRVHLGLRFRTL